MNKHQQWRNTGVKLGVVAEQTGREFKATISTFSNNIQRRQVQKQMPVDFDIKSSWQILPRTQNGTSPPGRWAGCAPHGSLPLTAQVCAGHTIPYFLVSEEIKTHNAADIASNPQTQKQFRWPSRQAVVQLDYAMLLSEKSWTIKSGASMPPYHTREDTLKGWKRRTCGDSDLGSGWCQGIERKQWTAHGVVWAMKPLWTTLADTGCCTLGSVTSDNSCSHLWRLHETMHTRKLFKLLHTVLLLGYFSKHLKHVLVCMFRCIIQTSYWLSLSVHG